MAVNTGAGASAASENPTATSREPASARPYPAAAPEPAVTTTPAAPAWNTALITARVELRAVSWGVAGDRGDRTVAGRARGDPGLDVIHLRQLEHAFDTVGA